MEEKKIRKDQEEEIEFFEEVLGVKFPQSYRQFLLNREEIERKAGFRLPVLGLPPKIEKEKEEKEEEKKEKKKEGIVLSFWPGDPQRGRFAWITNYRGRIVGLCSLANCRYCNLKERLFFYLYLTEIV